jgi:ABC-2 type transport system permease protein
MLKLIISHETRQIIRTGALWSILALLVGAIVFAAWSGGRSIGRQMQGAEAAIAFEDGLREHMRKDTEKYEAQVIAANGEYQFAAVRHAPGQGPPQGTNAGAVGAETAKYVKLQPTGLAALSVGQSDIQLNYLPVSLATTLDVTKNLELENPVNLATGTFDIAFVVIFLLPIFILAMSYDLLSSEKERGTLAMILAHPISVRELMASKIISRAAMMLAVVLTFGLIALVTVGTGLDTADTWMRFALWMVATLLYSMFWFALAVLVNVYGKNSATNGTVLAGLWLILVVITPTLVSMLATTVYPAPSRMELTIAARAAQTEAEKNAMAKLDEYYYDHLEFVPDGDKKAMDFLTLAQANANSIEKAVRPLYDDFQLQLNKQEGLVQRFQFLSPAIMMQLALNEISGTSADRYEYFLNQVYDFHSEWREYFSTKFLQRYPLKPADYDTFPAFTYEEEPFSAVLIRLMPSLLGMLILFLGVTLVPFLALKKYQVAAR